MASPPIILVPGFWLGAWAWDEVAALLRADGHDVTALTLPGLESADADRSAITFADHVDAIVDAVEAAPTPGRPRRPQRAGFSGYAASDRVPERIAAMVYVDTAPGKPPLDPTSQDGEKPMVWEDIVAEENLDGLTEEQKATFRERAVPVPGGVLREPVRVHERRPPRHPVHDHRDRLHRRGSTRRYAKEHPESSFLAGIPELRNVTWIDLPTSHWPMWSRPERAGADHRRRGTCPSEHIDRALSGSVRNEPVTDRPSCRRTTRERGRTRARTTVNPGPRSPHYAARPPPRPS